MLGGRGEPELLGRLRPSAPAHGARSAAILDRAGVGRTAFYAHYRNKTDVLHSSYEGVFAWLEPLADRPLGAGRPGDEAGARLFPVAEFLAHVGEERALVGALRRDGLLDDVWALLAGHAARMIARRLAGWAGRPAGAPPLAAAPAGAAAAAPGEGPVGGVGRGEASAGRARPAGAHARGRPRRERPVVAGPPGSGGAGRGGRRLP
ncbi:hypothetical protein tb265_11640 [Gemmatimonadetes bacterium T265]|nr:hypothetical protein tb265_11640 [Gemmatimonadetes bacterium T265]